jgi:DNA (cytosine-5)-methyltransferase 1
MAVVALEGNGARPSHKGSGYSEDNVSFTLNATEQHGVAYGIDRATYNMGQNAQFGIAVEEEVEPTMVAKGPVQWRIRLYHEQEFLSYGSRGGCGEHAVATDYKDPPTISEEPYYIVRRLTPTECARLQGFPTGGAVISERQSDDEELYYWYKVFETWRLATAPDSKPKTSKQIKKWLAIRIPILRSIRCGATVWLCRAWFSCFRALCITHS